MKRFKVPVLRSAYEYGYYIVEAENEEEALIKGEILFNREDPDNMDPIGDAESELLRDEIEEMSDE